MTNSRFWIALAVWCAALTGFITTAFARITPPRSHFQSAMAEAENGRFQQAIQQLKEQIAEDSTFTEAFIRLADFYRYSGDLQSGESYFGQGITHAPENAALHLGAAYIARYSGDNQRTFEHCRLALDCGTAAPEAIQLLVESALQTENIDALPAVFRLLKKNPAQSHLADLGYAFWKYRSGGNLSGAISTLLINVRDHPNPFAFRLLGDVYLQSGEDSAAVSAYLKALESNLHEVQWDNIPLLRRLGAAYAQMSVADSADYYFLRALNLAVKFADLSEQMEIHRGFSLLHLENQKYAQVIRNGAQARTLMQRLGETSRLPDLNMDVGHAYEKMGDHQRAVKNYLLAAAEATELSRPQAVSQACNEAGRILTKLGRWLAAAYYLDRSVEAAQAAGSEESKYLALMNLADLYRLQGETDRAKEEYGRVLRFAQDAGQYQLSQTCLLKLANLYLRSGTDLNSADYYLVLADAAAKQSLNLRNAANIRWMQGRLSLAHNDIEKAETYFLDAIQLGRDIGSEVSVLAGNAGLIATYLSANFTKLAAVRADTAFTLLAQIGFLFLHDLNAEFFDLKNDLIVPAITAYSLLDQREKIYLACETYKTFHHIRDVAPIKYLIDKTISDSEHWRLDDFNREIDRKRQELWDIWRRDQQDNLYVVAQIKNDINRIEKERLAYRADLMLSHPELYSLMQPMPEPLADLRSRLADLNSVFVHYLVGEKTIDIVVIRADSIFCARADYGATYLKNLIEQINPILSHSPSASLPGNGASNEFRLDLAAQLYQVILDPIKDYIPKGSALIIAPDDVLNRVPLQIMIDNYNDLTDKYDYKNAHFLAEDHAITYVPYAKFLDWPYRRTVRKQKSLLAFSGLSQTGTNHHHGSERNGAEDAVLATKQIVQLVGSSDFCAEGDATRSRFMDRVPYYKAIHLTAPGSLEDGSPLYSKFYLKDSAAGVDSVETRDLFDMKLSATIVTLNSVTQSSSPRTDIEGMGCNALLHALNFAGVPVMVMNRWGGNGGQGRELLLNFYSSLKAGQNTSAALQQAQKSLMTAGNHNPFLWAGLVVYGSPSPVKFEGNNLRLVIVVTIFGVVLLGVVVSRHYFLETRRKNPRT